MAAPRVCVLRAPGTNCDVETAFAFTRAGAVAERLHLNRLLEQPHRLAEFQILCIPGGFSFGDDIGAGVIFGMKLRHHLREVLREFLETDRLVLGICNGFQVLLKAGLLPDPGASLVATEGGRQREATLTWNNNGRYTALWVRLRISSSQCVFLRGLEEIELPIAHAEGRLVVREPSKLAEWYTQGQVALRYWLRRGCESSAGAAAEKPILAEPLPYPDNPNGSMGDVAGLCDPSGRVLGLMPHPERYIDGTQHPQWTRRERRDAGDGLALFRNAVAYFA